MNRYRCGCAVMVAGFSAGLLSFTASANSSWVWISETRPFDLLPAVIVLTLAIEIAAVLLALKKKNFWKVLFFVALGNLLSFAAPYVYSFWTYTSVGFPFQKYLDNWPSYTVGVVFLVMTLLIELPVVWLGLRKDAKHQGRFALVILLANVVTTGLTALAEHVFCRGSW